jgi:hypothetical protein
VILEGATQNDSIKSGIGLRQTVPFACDGKTLDLWYYLIEKNIRGETPKFLKLVPMEQKVR